MTRFEDLAENEVLALAISQEEEDARIYGEFAASLKPIYPDSAALFDRMREEEIEHLGKLTALYKSKFGDHIPLVRRGDVKGFMRRKPLWRIRPLGLDAVRAYASDMECATRDFYTRAAKRTNDEAVRALLEQLAREEQSHIETAKELQTEKLTPEARAREEEARRRMFLLQYVQPGLAGLMDGSVSTLAPLFAAAFATHSTWETFLVGMAASIGAGISMGFAEALSDDGAITGRGHPWLRGFICGAMTTAGGLGHTLPYLIPSFWIATTVAIAVVLVELAAIAWIRHRYMDTPLLGAAVQVGVGGALVFVTGILIGSS